MECGGRVRRFISMGWTAGRSASRTKEASRFWPQRGRMFIVFGVIRQAPQSGRDVLIMIGTSRPLWGACLITPEYYKHPAPLGPKPRHFLGRTTGDAALAHRGAEVSAKDIPPDFCRHLRSAVSQSGVAGSPDKASDFL